ncbi:MAG: prepilin peptidase CpaA [Azoarcus sp.]|nr:prepilin peptidase CpaA [Azoarcus sp.]
MAITTLVLLLLAAVATDIRRHRIPNVLVLTGLIAGTAFQCIPYQDGSFLSAPFPDSGLVPALAGIAVGFVCPLPIYLLRAMGAGDVKLLMVVGAFLGPTQAFAALIFSFAIGGVLALGMALYRRSFATIIANLRFMLVTAAVRAAGGSPPPVEPLQQTAGRLPYAVAIALGTLLQLVLIRSDLWS